MCEITRNNFQEKLPEIKAAIDDAKFIAIDLEFSALTPLKNERYRLFDTPAERYAKLKRNIEQVIPLQIGLTTFDFDPKTFKYVGTVYTFIVQPAAFPGLSTSYYFQTESIHFLTLFGFDFNKFAFESIPYLRKDQVADLQRKISEDEIVDCFNFRHHIEDLFKNELDTVDVWYEKARNGESLSLPTIFQRYQGKQDIIYFLQKNLRTKYANLWTKTDSNEFKVFKMPPEEYYKREARNHLENELLDNLTGFTEVFECLVQAKKPIVGHNCLNDLMLLITSFHCELPNKYKDFKIMCNDLFPIIFDTKHISYNLLKCAPGVSKFDNSLSTLYKFFNSNVADKLALNAPKITFISDCEGNYHNAGWDSFCSGYIFIRMAYLNVYKQYPKTKKFVHSELLGGLIEYKNSINLIRGPINSIKLDGEDPRSRRPPLLIVESTRKPINISQVASMLGNIGYVEIKKIPLKNNQALVAVDNYGNARRILESFRANDHFKIRQYNVFKHSPVIRVVVVGGIVISGAIIVWLIHSYQ